MNAKEEEGLSVSLFTDFKISPTLNLVYPEVMSVVLIKNQN
jgi:hypothetical protein